MTRKPELTTASQEEAKATLLEGIQEDIFEELLDNIDADDLEAVADNLATLDGYVQSIREYIQGVDRVQKRGG